MIALILAGGSGTRLQSVVKDKPKPMAQVMDRPFIRYLTDYLFSNGFNKIYISCFYLWEQIAQEYQKEISNNNVSIILEPSKLGTGGAIFYSITQIFHEHQEVKDIMVCNGDSFINFKPKDFLAFHKHCASTLTLASVKLENADRYGLLNTSNDDVISFREKEIDLDNSTKDKLINAGVYLINRSIKALFAEYYNFFLNRLNLSKNNKSINMDPLCNYNGEAFSFETEILIPLAKKQLLKHFCLHKSPFIDIGIPDDYAKACDFLKQFCK